MVPGTTQFSNWMEASRAKSFVVGMEARGGATGSGQNDHYGLDFECCMYLTMARAVCIWENFTGPCLQKSYIYMYFLPLSAERA